MRVREARADDEKRPDVHHVDRLSHPPSLPATPRRADGTRFPSVCLNSDPFGGGDMVRELMRTDHRSLVHLSRGEPFVRIMWSLVVVDRDKP